MLKVAVLLTCHNRKQKTITCLESLYNSQNIYNINLNVFLVDDGSTDGTTDAINSQFSDVNVIKGTGDLFWNQGMRLAWDVASKHKTYDYYLWLNDDTNIDQDAISHLFECYNDFINEDDDKEVIVVGACRDRLGEDEFSYGLRDGKKIIVPNGKIQQGRLLNGNLVLISKKVFKQIGSLSDCYTHGMGDHDYGLRAREKNIDLITTKKIIATCPTNKLIPGWCNPNKTLKQRWKILHTPLGLNIKEYKKFKKRFWPKKYFISILKIYLKCLFPTIYNKIMKLKD